MSTEAPHKREVDINLSPEQFRAIGHRLVDQIAGLFAHLGDRPVTTGETAEQIRALLHADRSLPETGGDPEELMAMTTSLLFNHSLYNGHPRFWGYITAPAAPIGVLAELLASAVNPNCGAWPLSPVASEIEAQTIRWIAELIGYPTTCGGILVSGGNMANFIGFIAARAAKADGDLRKSGVAVGTNGRLRAYCSAETHTWIQKAADMTGLGTDSIRWIPVDHDLKMNMSALRAQIDADLKAGDKPFLVVGTAGSVSTGAIDRLGEVADVCREYGLWFHADGAYGGFAACVPEVSKDLRALSAADSVAVDPHKWLYAPLEAGCALVRDPEALRAAFSYRPRYYHFGDEGQSFVDYGPQNSRGFRALKVWMMLQQAGRAGYERMIRDDIHLARHCYDLLAKHHQFEVFTHELSIATFRFVPSDLRPRLGEGEVESYLNKLNEDLLVEIEKGGELFLSPAVVREHSLLRMCVVNFRTTRTDVEALPSLVAWIGEKVDKRLRPVGM
jgi:glutamate/tyrosine decarboxylase-like PLP-dependent enzyme